MTDRIRTVTVFLDKDYRDVQVILDAIGMIKGVDHVAPQVVGFQDYNSRMTATLEMRKKVFEALDIALPLFPK